MHSNALRFLLPCDRFALVVLRRLEWMGVSSAMAQDRFGSLSAQQDGLVVLVWTRTLQRNYARKPTRPTTIMARHRRLPELLPGLLALASCLTCVNSAGPLAISVTTSASQLGTSQTYSGVNQGHNWQEPRQF